MEYISPNKQRNNRDYEWGYQEYGSHIFVKIITLVICSISQNKDHQH
jgi:hypothetical protein